MSEKRKFQCPEKNGDAIDNVNGGYVEECTVVCFSDAFLPGQLYVRMYVFV